MTEVSVLKYEDSEWAELAQPSQRNFYKDKKCIRLLNGKIKFKRIKGKNKKPHKFPFERCLDFNRAEITWEIRNDSRIMIKQLQLSKLMRKKSKLLQQNNKLVSLKKKEDLVELKFKIRRKKYQIKTRQRKLRKKLTATHFKKSQERSTKKRKKT